MTISVFQQRYSDGAVDDFSAAISTKKYSVALAAGTAKSVDVPLDDNGCMGLSISDIKKCLVLIKPQAGKNVWWCVNDTVVTASGLTDFTETSSELITETTGRYVKGGDTLSFKTDDSGGAAVNVCFYSLPNA